MYKGTLPQASTDADMVITIRARDSNTGLGFRLTGYGIDVFLKDFAGTTRISGSVADGKLALYPENNIPDCVVVLTFRVSEMNLLQPGTYTLACRVTSGTDTMQWFKFNQPIIEGGI